MHLRPGTPPPSPHPVEQAVYELVAAHPDTAFSRLQKLAADTPAITALQTRLRGLGLALTPHRAITDSGGPATAELRRLVALHGATVLRVADPAMAAALKVPDWSTSNAEAAGGTEFTGVSG